MVLAHSATTSSLPQLTVSVEHYSPGRARVSLNGELDLVTAQQLVAAFAEAFRAGARFVDVDVSGLAFCDAAGLRALTEAHLRWRSVSGRLVLRQVAPTLVRLLRITGLDETLIVEPPLTSDRMDGMTPSADHPWQPSALTLRACTRGVRTCTAPNASQPCVPSSRTTPQPTAQRTRRPTRQRAPRRSHRRIRLPWSPNFRP